MTRRSAYLLLLAAGVPRYDALAQTAPAGTSQPYPVKPVRVIVAFSAGGTTDILARAIGQKMTLAMGQQFVIDNRPGAGGTIGNDMVANGLVDPVLDMVRRHAAHR